jgi:hypothetical protein
MIGRGCCDWIECAADHRACQLRACLAEVLGPYRPTPAAGPYAARPTRGRRPANRRRRKGARTEDAEFGLPHAGRSMHRLLFRAIVNLESDHHDQWPGLRTEIIQVAERFATLEQCARWPGRTARTRSYACTALVGATSSGATSTAVDCSAFRRQPQSVSRAADIRSLSGVKRWLRAEGLATTAPAYCAGSRTTETPARDRQFGHAALWSGIRSTVSASSRKRTRVRSNRAARWLSTGSAARAASSAAMSARRISKEVMVSTLGEGRRAYRGSDND